jgi:hypothetical protein
MPGRATHGAEYRKIKIADGMMRYLFHSAQPSRCARRFCGDVWHVRFEDAQHEGA